MTPDDSGEIPHDFDPNANDSDTDNDETGG